MRIKRRDAGCKFAPDEDATILKRPGGKIVCDLDQIAEPSAHIVARDYRT